MKLFTTAGLVLAMSVSVTVVSSWASVPSPGNSTVPVYMKSGGFGAGGPGFSINAGPPDPTTAYNVVIRDALNAAVPNASIRVDFTNCFDFFLCTTELPGQNHRCPALDGVKGIEATTDALGQLTLYAVGACNNPGTTVPPAIFPGAGVGCAKVYANGVEMGQATVVIYDQNGKLTAGGVNGLDFSIAKNDIGAAGLTGAYVGRSDYAPSVPPALNGADLSALKSTVGCSGLGGCSNQGCPTAYCP